MSQLFASGGQSIGDSGSPSNEYSELIFRMNWLDLLAVQGTLKILLQHHSFNSLALSFVYRATLNPYTTTGKTIALTRGIFVGKVRGDTIFK